MCLSPRVDPGVPSGQGLPRPACDRSPQRCSGTPPAASFHQSSSTSTTRAVPGISFPACGLIAALERDTGGTEASMEGLTFRKPPPADTDRIAEIMFGEPRPEAIRGIGLGRIDRVRAIGRAYVRMPGSPKGWQWIVVAELDGGGGGGM